MSTKIYKFCVCLTQNSNGNIENSNVKLHHLLLNNLFNSCSALNPANQSWASVLQSFVTSRDVMDHIVFKHSPFRTSCSAVELKERFEQDVRITAAFQGDKSDTSLKQ